MAPRALRRGRGRFHLWLTRRAHGTFAAAIVLLAFGGPADAQLRPYEPFDWSIFDRPARVSATMGGSMLWDQRASLAGTEGRLLELGNVVVDYRVDRVAIEIGGTIYRALREKASFAPVAGGAVEQPLGRRADTGDYRVGTSILLTASPGRYGAILRFGSRLPTTDNTVGLERDAIDFFTTLGGRADLGRFRATAEVGLGIHGTRRDDFEQSDLFIYSLGLSRRSQHLATSILLLGQADGTEWEIRGTEPLAEARLRLQSTGATWIRADFIRGLADFSPGLGVSIYLGGTF